MKNPNAPNKKHGGPITAKGKLISSQNAIKGGLTTKQLLNQPEFERYSQLIKDLSTHYGTSNPLVPLQIERIARIQIQLERIQNAIDALYRQSELNPPTKTKKDVSQTDLVVLEMKFKISIGLLDKSFFERIQKTLNQIKFKAIIKGLYHQNRAADEFKEGKGPDITQDTLLGAYLFAEAAFYKEDISKYLKDKVHEISNTKTTKELYQKIRFEVLSNAIDIFKSPDMANVIATDNYYEFYQFQNWFEREIAQIPEQVKEILQSTERGIYYNFLIPKFDDLDRLMRYWVSL